MEGMYVAFIQGFPEEMPYMFCTVARPGNYLIVLFLFQGSAPVFCNNRLSRMFDVFHKGSFCYVVFTGVSREEENGFGSLSCLCRSSYTAFPSVAITEGSKW